MSRSSACGSGSAGSGSGMSTTKRSPVLTLRDGSSIVRSVRQRHAAAFDQRLHAAAREGRQGSRQRAVQPLAGGAFVEGHDVAAGVAHGVFLASPVLQASAPLWLKVLVIVMGLLIVAGFVVIAAEIARRMSTPQRRPRRQPPPPSPSASRCPPARGRVGDQPPATGRRPCRDARAAHPPTSSIRATAPCSARSISRPVPRVRISPDELPQRQRGRRPSARSSRP